MLGGDRQCDPGYHESGPGKQRQSGDRAIALHSARAGVFGGRPQSIRLSHRASSTPIEAT